MHVAQLGLGDLRMDSGPWAAVGAGDDIFLADHFSERDNAIAYQFRMLDELRWGGWQLP